MSEDSRSASGSVLFRGPETIGRVIRGIFAGVLGGVQYIGAVVRLLGQTSDRSARSALGRDRRVRFLALRSQCFRFGVRSVPITMLVQVFVGVILALNLAPTLAYYGQTERVADVVSIAVLRELGPLITAILLSGFAGASIAAELGAMVEGEEIKALKAHALDPIRFLVAPRVLATAVMLVGLTALANVCGVVGGWITAVYVLDIKSQVYLDLTAQAVGLGDYFTGLTKAFVFGVIIAGLACHEGLNVRGGAVGVGHATTTTVVKSIVSLIAADMIFTSIFYTLGW